MRLSRIAAEDKDYLWQQTEKAYGELIIGGQEKADGEAACRMPDRVVMDREGLWGQPPAIRHRLIMKAFAEIGLEKDISEERIKSADSIISKKQAPKTVEFPHGYRLKVAKGRVIFFRN